jgi:hypothetical protein
MVGQKGGDGKSISRDHKGGNPRGFGQTEWIDAHEKRRSINAADRVCILVRSYYAIDLLKITK